MKDKKHNVSLFFYTGLIFLVAVLLIVITFFAQSKIEKNQPVAIDTQTEGITQRAAVLSEENQALLEQNKTLQKELDEKNQTIADLNEAKALLESRQENSDLLFLANGYVSKKMYKEAKQALEQIDEQAISEDEKILYNSLMKKVGKD